MSQTKIQLVNYLDSEYRKLDKKYSKCIMLKRIRVSLIMNPYDQVGRKMASETKDLFKESILNERSTFDVLKRSLKIPNWILKQGWAKKSPIIFAILPLLFRMGIYSYDMYSDVQVIEELRQYEANFQTPTFSQFFNNQTNTSQSLEKFFFSRFREYGLPVLTEPCELLDLLEVIPSERIPLYHYFIIDKAQIHWNPNRNRNPHPSLDRNMTTDDLFEIVDALVNIYLENAEKTMAKWQPSDADKSVEKLIKTLESVKNSMSKAKNKSFWLNLFDSSIIKNITKFEPKLNTAIKIVKEIKETVVKTPISQVISKELDKGQAEMDEVKRIASDFKYQDLATHMKTKWKQDTNYTPSFESPLENEFTEEQKVCRTFCSKIIDVLNVTTLKEAVLAYSTSSFVTLMDNTQGFITQSFDDTVNITSKQKKQIVHQSGKGDFLSVSIIKSAKIFLIITMAWSLLYGLRNTIKNFYFHGHWPIFSNFQMVLSESYTDSKLFKEDGNTRNEYIAQSANRYNFNIHEAVNETLSAINVQVAVWISLATYIEKFAYYANRTFDVEITKKMFNLPCEGFRESAVFSSLIAGIISLTFAQWKQYMTRHENDLNVSGKLVYFFACLFNSLAIFATQTTFYTIGFPYFTGLLVIVIRSISHFDSYDPITKPNEVMTNLLYFVVVLMPLKFIQNIFDSIIKTFTDNWILHKMHHLNHKNRQGILYIQMNLLGGYFHIFAKYWF